ncbi:MAG: hypothetical protein M2R45_04064 [Verrucomicrobia subdivision 3 bacterium]|nr:hypothetical protein [Limisphaerales bacterium]MCS1417003.1 hypothetical protein [Limisphaerales bacterium]
MPRAAVKWPVDRRRDQSARTQAAPIVRKAWTEFWQTPKAASLALVILDDWLFGFSPLKRTVLS